MKAQGKVIVVTGAGNGIGKAVAELLLQRGARVAAVDISEPDLKALVAAQGASDRLKTFVCNIARQEDVEQLAADVPASMGAVDGLMHCAGIIQPFVPVAELGWDVIERVMAVNFWGTVYLNKAFLPALLARPEAHIVNISSMGGFLPVPGQTIYGASKAAVKLLTEGLHAELKGTSVGVTVVFPGGVATNITKNSGVSMPGGEAAQKKAAENSKIPITTPESAATQIVDGMEKNAYRVLVGKDARAMDALYRLHPQRAAAFIADKMKSVLGK